MRTCPSCEMEFEEKVKECPDCEIALDGEIGDENKGTYLTLENGETLAIDSEQVLLGRMDPLEGVNPDLDLGLYKGFDLGVSRKHAIISREETGFAVEDLGSTNGTIVNRQRLEPGGKIPISDGDTIFLGHLKIVFHGPDAKGGAA